MAPPEAAHLAAGSRRVSNGSHRCLQVSVGRLRAITNKRTPEKPKRKEIFHGPRAGQRGTAIPAAGRAGMRSVWTALRRAARVGGLLLGYRDPHRLGLPCRRARGDRPRRQAEMTETYSQRDCPDDPVSAQAGPPKRPLRRAAKSPSR